MSEFETAAFTTLKATWFQLICARVFGKKTVGRDSGCVITAYYWRGRIYVWGCAQEEA